MIEIDPKLAVTVLKFLGITTAIAMVLRGAIPLLRALAQRTATKRDDQVVGALELVVNDVIVFCDVVKRMLPRVTIGPLPSTQPIARSLPPRSGNTIPGPAPVLGVEPMKPLSVPPPVPSNAQRAEGIERALKDEGEG